MRSINLDVVEYEGLVAKPQKTALGPVTFELVELHGPAGGNPVVRATGEDGALLLWLLKEYTLESNVNGAGELKRARAAVDDAVYYMTGIDR